MPAAASAEIRLYSESKRVYPFDSDDAAIKGLYQKKRLSYGKSSRYFMAAVGQDFDCAECLQWRRQRTGKYCPTRLR